MHLRSTVWQAAPLAVLAALSVSPVAAQSADDRYSFLKPLASNPAPAEYLRVAGPRAPRRRASHPLSLVRLSEHVPFPRTVVRESFSGQFESAAATEEAAASPRTRVAYAAQPADDGLAIWSMIPIQPMGRRPQVTLPATVSMPIAAVPETSGLPHLEHRILRGRDSNVFSPDLLVLIENKAIAHGVPLDLAHAVVTVESNYDPRLTGGAGAIGLMQIKYITARDMGFRGSARDLLNPATNLEWGMRYLAKARKLAKGDLCGTVLRYQAGHGAVHMTHAAAVYCTKVRALIAASDNGKKVAQARAIR